MLWWQPILDGKRSGSQLIRCGNDVFKPISVSESETQGWIDKLENTSFSTLQLVDLLGLLTRVAYGANPPAAGSLL